ncbi:ABC-type sugar transport system, periplasmic component [Phyllobacterium sp. YR531]|nr:ABC-type sugar transport system, periplasmic component [Phyllobacterium sp. YR531]
MRNVYLTMVAAGAAILVVLANAASAQEGKSIYVIGARSDDAFFAVIKKGVDDAAKAMQPYGGSVKYLALQSYDKIGADTADLVRTATNQGAAGIAVPNWVPEAENPAITAAISAGIPVMLYNSGSVDVANAVGALNYIGTDDKLAGIEGGKYLAQNGATNAVCVNTVPGSANLEARCGGIAEAMTAAGKAAKQLPLPATSFGDPIAVTEAIKARLLNDPTIDSVITVGQVDADSAANAIAQAGANGRVKLASFDVSQRVLNRIKDGTQMFAIDQQPYLQGFLATSLLHSYVAFGSAVPTKPILTGPTIVDSSNVEQVLAGAKQGTR